MKIYDEIVETLSRHLCAEIDCLERLLDTLNREAIALRELSLDELDAIAPLKEKSVNRQAGLALRRREILARSQESEQAISTLSELVALADLDEQHALVGQIARLRVLAQEIVDSNHRNRAFAESGNGLVSTLVQLIDSWRSPSAKTYARNGHLRRHLLDATPRRESVCSA